MSSYCVGRTAHPTERHQYTSEPACCRTTHAAAPQNEDNLREALRFSSALLSELRTSLLTPQKYFELYMQAFNQLSLLQVRSLTHPNPALAFTLTLILILQPRRACHTVPGSLTECCFFAVQCVCRLALDGLEDLQRRCHSKSSIRAAQPRRRGNENTAEPEPRLAQGYFSEESMSKKRSYADMYELVQHAGNVLPRLCELLVPPTLPVSERGITGRTTAHCEQQRCSPRVELIRRFTSSFAGDFWCLSTRRKDPAQAWCRLRHSTVLKHSTVLEHVMFIADASFS